MSNFQWWMIAEEKKAFRAWAGLPFRCTVLIWWKKIHLFSSRPFSFQSKIIINLVFSSFFSSCWGNGNGRLMVVLVCCCSVVLWLVGRLQHANWRRESNTPPRPHPSFFAILISCENCSVVWAIVFISFYGCADCWLVLDLGDGALLRFAWWVVSFLSQAQHP